MQRQAEEEEEIPGSEPVVAVQRQTEEETQLQKLLPLNQTDEQAPVYTKLDSDIASQIQRQKGNEEEVEHVETPTENVGEEKPVFPKLESGTVPLIQRQEENEEEREETEQAEPLIEQTEEGNIAQTKLENSNQLKVADISENIKNPGPGMPLSPSVRRKVEPILGVDLSHVRVHKDSQASESTRALRAKAFTSRNHIWVGQNQSSEDTALMAHEATHFVQQTGSSVSTSNIQRKSAQFGNNAMLKRESGLFGDEKNITHSEVSIGIQEVESETMSAPPPTDLETPPEEPTNVTSAKDGKSRPQGAQKIIAKSEKAPATLAKNGPKAIAESKPVAKAALEIASSTPPESKAIIHESLPKEMTISKETPEVTSAGAIGGATENSGKEAGSAKTGIAPPTAPQVDTNSAEGVLKSLTTVPATSLCEAISMAQSSASEIQAREKADLEASFPKIERPSGLPRISEKKKDKETKLKPGKPKDAPKKNGRKGLPPETHHVEPSSPVPGTKVSTTASEPKEESGGMNWWKWLVNRVRNFLKSIPTTDPGVSTSAGPRPNVDLSGDADPAQNESQKQVSDQEVSAKQVEADAATTPEFGEKSKPFPDVPKEMMRPSYKPASPPSNKGGAIKKPTLPNGVHGPMNRTLAPWISEKNNEQLEEYRLEQSEYKQKSMETRAEGQRRIAEETEKTRVEQIGIQRQVRDDVDAERERWREENRKIREDYASKAGAERLKVDKKIDDKVQKAEKDADTELIKAEQKAEAEKRKKEAEAAEAKRREENKPRSWWDRVKGAVSSVFDAIKKAVNAIFDALRKIVKGIIEAAKAIVRGIIELARMAVVGIIKAFGEFLKGLVTVALAAFPDAAAKARAWIDNKVDTAVDAVNKAAEALKKATDAILDWVGEVLDSALAFLQKVYNAILSVIEFLVVGLIEIMQKIGHLVDAATEMPDHFWGQAQEEVIGMNLNEPLPFERTEPPKSQDIATAGKEAGLVGSNDVDLINRQHLSESDVTVDEAAELDEMPKFFAGLDLKEGQELEFGESNDPSRSINAIKAEALGTAPITTGPSTEVEEGASYEASQQNIAKTPEEELQELMAQKPEGGCTKEKKDEPAKGGEVPEHLKKGPFTSGQRGRYLWHQMKQGIKQWFDCNWPWLLAAAVGALLGFILLNIVTGGAALAALPLIMQIVGAIMIGVAIVRVTAYVGEYISQGWQGKIKPAAKSLARGLAIGAIELIFALLFNLGSVIKALKGGIKGAVKTAAKAAKATVTTTIKNVRQLGKLGPQAGKAMIKNGKFVLKGIKGGVVKGAKSLDDLAKRLWNKVRFRKFRIRIKNQRFQLLGYINPWIILADGSIKRRVTVKGGSSRVGEMVEMVGTRRAGMILGVVDELPSNLVKELKKMKVADRKALYNRMSRMKNIDEIRSELLRGAATSKHAKELRQSLLKAKNKVRPGDHAHHIVPSTHPLADEARKILNKFKIGINDAANGAFVDDITHAGLHSNAYIEAVTKTLRGAKSKPAALQALKNIKRMIKAGKFS